MQYSWAGGKLIHEKNQKQKSRDTVPLNLYHYKAIKEHFTSCNQVESFGWALQGSLWTVNSEHITVNYGCGEGGKMPRTAVPNKIAFTSI